MSLRIQNKWGGRYATLQNMALRHHIDNMALHFDVTVSTMERVLVWFGLHIRPKYGNQHHDENWTHFAKETPMVRRYMDACKVSYL